MKHMQLKTYSIQTADLTWQDIMYILYCWVWRFDDRCIISVFKFELFYFTKIDIRSIKHKTNIITISRNLNRVNNIFLDMVFKCRRLNVIVLRSVSLTTRAQLVYLQFHQSTCLVPIIRSWNCGRLLFYHAKN
jgi:hypothetical protein